MDQGAVFREGSNDHQPLTPLDPLPHYVAAEEDREGYPYPLHLLSPKAHAFLNSQYGNMAYQRRIQGGQWVTVHADDAEARGIEEGQAVRVYNAAGEFQAVARITGDDQAARGVVVCPGGHWRKLTPGGNTVNTLARTAFSDMGNAPGGGGTAGRLNSAGPSFGTPEERGSRGIVSWYHPCRRHRGRSRAQRPVVRAALR